MGKPILKLRDKESPAETLQIRIGTPSDMDDCMQLAFSACDDNALMKPDPMLLAQDMYSSLCLHHGIVGLIGQPGGKPEGFALLRVGTLWYSSDPCIEEKAIFIAPEFRSAKGGRGRRLAEFSKKVADTLELPLLIGILSNSRTEGKVKMYTRIFGAPAGAYFVYGAKTGAHTSLANG